MSECCIPPPPPHPSVLVQALLAMPALSSFADAGTLELLAQTLAAADPTLAEALAQALVLIAQVLPQAASNLTGEGVLSAVANVL